jgi:acyl transferase domain-containing protein
MSSADEATPIAVVGLGCRFPGGASSGEKFWDLLMNKKSARKATPANRFNADAFYHPNGEKGGCVSFILHQYTQDPANELHLLADECTCWSLH